MPEKSIRCATSLRLAKSGLALAALASLTGMQGRLSDFDDRLLASHNRERDLHGVPALVWDDRLARGAEQWATHLARTGKFEHSPDDPEHKPEGENKISTGAFLRKDPDLHVAAWDLLIEYKCRRTIASSAIALHEGGGPEQSTTAPSSIGRSKAELPF